MRLWAGGRVRLNSCSETFVHGWGHGRARRNGAFPARFWVCFRNSTISRELFLKFTLGSSECICSDVSGICFVHKLGAVLELFFVWTGITWVALSALVSLTTRVIEKGKKRVCMLVSLFNFCSFSFDNLQFSSENLRDFSFTLFYSNSVFWAQLSCHATYVRSMFATSKLPKHLCIFTGSTCYPSASNPVPDSRQK